MSSAFFIQFSYAHFYLIIIIGRIYINEIVADVVEYAVSAWSVTMG